MATDESFYILRYNQEAMQEAMSTNQGIDEDGIEAAFDVRREGGGWGGKMVKGRWRKEKRREEGEGGGGGRMGKDSKGRWKKKRGGRRERRMWRKDSEGRWREDKRREREEGGCEKGEEIGRKIRMEREEGGGRSGGGGEGF